MAPSTWTPDRRLLAVAGVGLGAVALCLIVAGVAAGKEAGAAEEAATDQVVFQHRGRELRFGPFVGYRFEQTEDPTTIRFVCRNERQFYTDDLPAGTILYGGEARLVELAPANKPLPRKGRVNPLRYDEVPQPWLATRPAPVEDWRHFHSCHDTHGAVRSGYWLRHEAEAAFVYDMGGRVGPESVLYHRVEPGIDRGFAQLMEFDHGSAGEH